TTPANPTNSTSAAFTFTANDPVGGGPASGVNHLECKLDAGSYLACTGPASYGPLGEGNHTFSVRAFDNAGNASTVASYSWLVDTTLPTVVINTTPANPTNSTSAAFTFTANDPVGGGPASGVNHLECKLDAGSYATCTSPASYGP